MREVLSEQASAQVSAVVREAISDRRLSAQDVAQRLYLSRTAARQRLAGSQPWSVDDVNRLPGDLPLDALSEMAGQVWLSSGDVARLFGVSRRTVVRWATSGKLPHMVTPGGHHRFSREDVVRLMEGRR